MIENDYQELITKSKLGDDPVYQYIENTDNDLMLDKYYVHDNFGSTWYNALITISCNKLNDGELYICAIKDTYGQFKYAFICINLLKYVASDNHVLIPSSVYAIMHDKLYASIFKFNDANLLAISNIFTNNANIRKRLWIQELIACILCDSNIKYSCGISVANDDYINLCNSATEKKREGQYDQAIQLLIKAIEMQPYNGIAYYNLGKIYFATKQYDQSIHAYTKAYLFGTGSTAPERNNQILQHLGYSLMLKTIPSRITTDGVLFYLSLIDPFRYDEWQKRIKCMRSAYHSYQKSDAEAVKLAEQYVQQSNKSSFNLYEQRTSAMFNDFLMQEDVAFLSNTDKAIKTINKTFYGTKNNSDDIFSNPDITIQLFKNNHIVVSKQEYHKT